MGNNKLWETRGMTALVNWILVGFTSFLWLELAKPGVVPECPANHLKCLQEHLVSDPTECESDNNINIESFIEGLGGSYEADSLLPVDAYFLWSKIREEIQRNQNADVVPGETKELSSYTLDNREYGQLLEEVKDLKPWKTTYDCTVWAPVKSRKEQVKKSVESWLKLATLLDTKGFQEKVVLFGKGRPTPLAEAFSDKSSPVRFILQNLIAEHNQLVTLKLIKELGEKANRTGGQVEGLENKQNGLKVLVETHKEEIDQIKREKLQEETAQSQRITNLEDTTSEESIANIVLGTPWSENIHRTLEELSSQLESVKQTQLQLQNAIDVESSGHESEEIRIDSEQNSEIGDPTGEVQSSERGVNRTLRKRNISSGVSSKKLAGDLKDLVRIVKSINELWDQIAVVTGSVTNNVKKITKNNKKIKEEHDWEGRTIAQNWRESNSTFLQKLAKLIPESNENLCLLSIAVGLVSIIISIIIGVVVIIVYRRVYRDTQLSPRRTIHLLPEKTLRRSRGREWRTTERNIRTCTGIRRQTIELQPRTKSVKWTKVRQRQGSL